MPIPILDNHVHLDPVRGRHVAAVKDFERQGGTHIIISSMPYEGVPVRTARDFRETYDMTIAIKDRVNSETGVRAYATVGPYPADLLELEKTYDLQRAKEIMMEAMDLAAGYVREGKALAIGEVGRPHFPVSPEEWAASNEIMLYAMKLAREVGCAVVLHTESASPSSMRELAEMARSAGLPTHRVVKHFCPPLVLPEENHGLMPSVLVGRDAARIAISKGTRFLMETDFMDDPSKPGAVLNITTVPKRTFALMKEGLVSEEQARTIHEDNPRLTYGDLFS
ncbi:MAG: TatD family hydrolase [Thermoplasmata archaeon]